MHELTGKVFETENTNAYLTFWLPNMFGIFSLLAPY
jgi:hypothetical protein